jgi:serine/threonine-protein kinase RsbW
MTSGGTEIAAHLDLSSRFENIEVAERSLLELCSQVGCSGEDQYWLVTALREAMANAVRHGNREDPDRRVAVELVIASGTVTIRVADQGSGFDPSLVPDPTEPSNLLRPSGRGIFYMKQFMDRVEFSRTPSGGTAVLLVRKLQPSATRSSQDEEPDS